MNWWKTHPTSSNTTSPSNPEQEEKLGRESIEEVQQGSINNDDPPQEKFYPCVTCPNKKKDLGEEKVKIS